MFLLWCLFSGFLLWCFGFGVFSLFLFWCAVFVFFRCLYSGVFTVVSLLPMEISFRISHNMSGTRHHGADFFVVSVRKFQYQSEVTFDF